MLSDGSNHQVEGIWSYNIHTFLIEGITKLVSDNMLLYRVCNTKIEKFAVPNISRCILNSNLVQSFTDFSVSYTRTQEQTNSHTHTCLLTWRHHFTSLNVVKCKENYVIDVHYFFRSFICAKSWHYCNDDYQQLMSIKN